jgi:SOS response regulatory protein OraA/RecX
MTGAEAKTSLADCRETALSLLDRQAYLSPALCQKLRQRGFAEPLVRQVVADLIAAGLLNDVETARSWLARKRESGTPLGEQRLRAALYRRGLSAATVADACGDGDLETRRSDELARAITAARGKLRALAREPDSRVRQTKLLRFLAGRGFSRELASLALQQLAQPGEP